MSEAAAPTPPLRALLQDATLQIRRLRERVQQLEAAGAAADEPIAIVAMACRFPGGAHTPQAFWELLQRGVDAVGEVPARSWDGAAWHDAQRGMVTRHGAFVADDAVMDFDPPFFGIAPRDAERLDPQQRLLLEVAHEALENAGLAPFGQRGHATGVYVGTGFDDYARRHVASGDPARIDGAGALGTHRAIAAGRVAYSFGLQGPVMQLDTTCSSSLLAVHLACQALRLREADRMLAGGVNLMLAPEPGIGFSRLGALSADGRCRSFDAAASGYGRGEGCGLVLLERLSDALAAGRPVLALIRGSAANHDGASNGLTAPSGPAQSAVIRAALARAGWLPADVQLVEAHGTATPLGDPIELLALAEAYGAGRREPLWVGSVKTNIGHLESAAGVAGLIKLVLALQHAQVPPHLHLQQPNPQLPWARLPLQVPRAAMPWPQADGPRRAAVSSFGMSGTNVHLLLEQAPPVPSAAAPAPRRWQILPLAARHAAGFAAQRATMAAWLAAPPPDLDLAALAQALGASRSHGPLRQALVVDSLESAHSAFAAAAAAPPRRAPPKIAFLFTGQGAQQLGMGRQLLREWPAFRAAFERCAAQADAQLPRPLTEVLDSDDGALHQTGYAQPALFVLQRALVALWRAAGVQPQVVLGHSVGEYAAAVSAGVMAQADALRLLLERARRMQALPAGGAMGSLRCGAAQAAALLAPGAEIAARNGPLQTVVAGPLAAIEATLAAAAAQGIAGLRLPVSHAFHSAAMVPMLAGFAEVAAGVTLAAPTLDMVSSHSGRLAGAEVAQPGYWVAQLREAVAFDAALDTLLAQGVDAVVEIGPQPHLLGLLRAKLDADTPLLLPSLRGSAADETQAWLQAAARLYEAGAALDWAVLAPPAGAPPVLPNTPFVRRRCWIDPPGAAPAAPPSASAWPGRALPLAGELRVFERTLSIDDELAWHEHRVAGRVLLPAAASLCAALAAARQVAPGSAWCVSALQFECPLVLPEDAALPVQWHWQPQQDGAALSLHARDAAGGWLRHVQARLQPAPPAPVEDDAPLASWPALPQRLLAQALYERFAQHGLDYGAHFRALAEIAWDGELALGRLRDGPSQGHWHDAADAVASLDAGLQLAGVLLAEGGAAPGLPAAIGAFQPLQPGVPAWVAARRRGRGEAQLRWYDAQGRCLARLDGLRLAAAARPPAGIGAIELQWRPLPWARADEWPALPALQQCCRAAFDAALASADCAEAEALQLVLERLSAAWAARALHGLDPAAVPAAQQRWLAALHRAAQTHDGEDAAAQQAEAEARWPHSPELRLVGRCGAALPQLLRAEADALALLFPDGDLGLLSELYEDSPGARVMNGLLRAALAEALAALPSCSDSDAPLRVLEIGAGTGGSTAQLLPLLAGWAAAGGRHIDYRFTDVSPHFLQRARERFAAYPFVRFGLFDVEADAQSAEPPADLVIAANVLHATADLQATLRRVHASLAPGGLLLLLEAGAPLAWLDLVFGSMPGWWRFGDSTLRPAHPLLPAARWVELLRAGGFDALPLEGARPLAQSVLLARRRAGPACRVLGAPELAAALGAQAAPDFEPAGGTQLLVLPLPAIAGAPSADHSLAVLQALQLLLAALPRWPAAPRLVLLDFGADEQAAAALRRAALWGLVQVLQAEHPELHTTLLQAGDLHDAARALRQLGAERHLRCRAGRLEAARLQPLASLPLRLQGEAGTLDALRWQSFEAAAPGPGEVRLRVRVAGLNFRDLLIALGQYPHPDPARPDAPGAECVAEVLACGAGVADLVPGTRVLALAAGAFASEVKVPRALLLPLPDDVDDAAAATLPVAFLTAWHGLVECAALSAGERVLIHNGTGGVGMAAIRIAQQRGAEVYASASRAKWPALRALGVQHLLDSRAGGFAAQIAAWTGGQGVEVVLNPLPGALQRDSLAALAPGGRFVEIGKGEGLDDAGFAALAPTATLHRVDLAMLARQRPAQVQALLQRLVDELAAGRVQPLPRRVFEAGDAVAALRTLQQARHVGKLLLRVPAAVHHSPMPTPRGCTLITGGLGGLGLEVARWLVARGARELLLVGRRGVPDAAVAAQLDALRALGARIHVRALDVTDAAALAALVDEFRGTLRGIVHAAGVLDDAPLAQQDAARWRRVLAPKLDAAWSLHALSESLPLDFFVLFGSAAGLVGTPGQANHAAANAALDGLARWRRARGLPALCLGWGAWARVGSALHYAGLPGVEAIEPPDGLQWLQRLWAAPQPALGVLAVDWPRLLAQPALAGDPLYAALQARADDGVAPQAAAGTGRGALRHSLLALPPAERAAALDAALAMLLAQTLGLAAAEIDRGTGFFELGLDSLSALELKNRLQQALALTLPATLVFDQPTPAALTAFLLDRIEPAPAAPASNAGGSLADQLDARLDALDRLLDEAPLG